jgi:hypothetical protein
MYDHAKLEVPYTQQWKQANNIKKKLINTNKHQYRQLQQHLYVQCTQDVPNQAKGRGTSSVLFSTNASPNVATNAGAIHIGRGLGKRPARQRPLRCSAASFLRSSSKMLSNWKQTQKCSIRNTQYIYIYIYETRIAIYYDQNRNLLYRVLDWSEHPCHWRKSFPREWFEWKCCLASCLTVLMRTQRTHPGQ